MLQGAAQGLLQLHGQLKSTEASIDRVFEILQSRARVTERPDAVPLIVGSTKALEISFESVTFGYEAGRQVLTGIDLYIEPDALVALVGATGAGKSTLAALVPRLFDPWQGRVCLAGQDLRALTLDSVRRSIALVPQEPFILPLSMAENIAFGRPGASPDEIRRAAQTAGAAEFIERLPQGYETFVGERGSTLSAGQRQRLAIARAVLKNAPILILDEPTSNLDAGTEHEVMSALERLMAGRTCVVIAHRLSTVRRADRIVVLDQGRIVEQGSHEQLLALGGYYERLCSQQRTKRSEVG